MLPWVLLNARGRILLVMCVINVIIAVHLANAGSATCIIPFLVAMFCGICTFSLRNQKE